MSTENKTTTEIKKQVTVTDSVLATINGMQETGELVLPKNYAVSNALKAAWIYLQDAEDKNHKPVLEVCSRTSISKSLLEMVTKGLSVAKKQCYFVAHGTELTFVPSYFGTVTVAKRDAGVEEANGQVIYKGDVFKYAVDFETGRKKVVEHEQNLEDIDNNNIVGAYAIVKYNDGTTKAEIMPMTQIRQAWLQGATSGNSPAHKKFPDQMAIRTVINRALKLDNASADDSHLMNDDDGSVPERTALGASTTEQSNAKAIEEVNIEDAKIVEEKPEQPTQPVQKVDPPKPQPPQTEPPF